MARASKRSNIVASLVPAWRLPGPTAVALVSALALLVAAPLGASACSYFEVESPGGTWVIGRTMEFGGGGGLAGTVPPGLTWQVVIHPRGQDGKFNNRYGFVGLDQAPEGLFSSDGMNELGLTISMQTMRSAEYEVAEPGKTILGLQDVIPWVLGQFSSVPEVVAGLENVSVVVSEGVTREDYIHWALADAEGNSAVLEYVSGKRVLHKNDVRVMTNDPDFLWHLKNLNMYVGLTPREPSANSDIQLDTEVGMVPQVWSHGFNLLGLPGDSSPASRFVRMFYLRQYATLAEPVASVDDAIVLATGLVNNVFIPRGTVAPVSGGAGSIFSYELTQFALLKIPAKRRLLFRSYRNMAWREVNLQRLRWDKRASIPVEDGTLGVQDVTVQLQPSMVDVI